jgi:hypothetical protein
VLANPSPGVDSNEKGAAQIVLHNSTANWMNAKKTGSESKQEKEQKQSHV